MSLAVLPPPCTMLAASIRLWPVSQDVISDAQKSLPPSHKGTASSASIRPWVRAEG